MKLICYNSNYFQDKGVIAIRINCDAANKTVKQLQGEVDALLSIERDTSTYTYGADEKERPEAPEYSFEATSKRLEELQGYIRTIKHAINQFNVSTVLPDFGITIDEALVKMAMLTQRKKTLNEMRRMQALQRTQSYHTAAEYRVRNFDPKPVREAYDAVSKELLKLQQALNWANLSKEIEIDLDLPV